MGIVNWFKKLFTRQYDAAKNYGANRLYRPRQSSAAQECSESWQAVTNITRDLDRNNPHVAGLKRRFQWSLVGEGNWPRPKILKKGAVDKYDFDKNLNIEILKRWEKWSKKASANGDTIYQLQRVAANTFFIDGGVLIRKVYKDRGMCLEAIELDQLDSSYDREADLKGTRVVDGIEIDSYNEPIAYYIKRRFPTEANSDTIRVKAEEIINLFDRERPTQIRGISRLASGAMNLKNIKEFRADTMTLARVATGYGIFIETPNPEDGFQEAYDPNDDIEYINPGAVRYLRSGEKATVVNSQHPAANYADFVKSELMSASVGTGMSYESVSNDGSNTNFSGSRQMMLLERAMSRTTFAIFEEIFYSRIYEWFIENEVYFNNLKMSNFEEERERYLSVSWSRPKREWVDPLKDANTAKTEIDMGANTLTEYCEQNGKDIEEVVATKKYEKELFMNAGLLTEEEKKEVEENA